MSTRKAQPFVPVNCAAIPDELFESEIFGYEAGAFSGAKKEGKPGKIELAQHGTLFLDEISELPYQAQGKLLRVLQEREVERLGGTGTKKC
ncbi:sigma 54-interacting transcriptional regulator [Peribacillus frigoritolerans]|nr:sigma 54-interacting transcriptional regulator [Peribacillus frigoritolerans]